jgi:hypothetical protein
MNERIRELADQAGIFKLGMSDELVLAETEYRVMETFAELIVRECAEIADKAEPYKANELIKEHFGVTE